MAITDPTSKSQLRLLRILPRMLKGEMWHCGLVMINAAIVTHRSALRGALILQITVYDKDLLA